MFENNEGEGRKMKRKVILGILIGTQLLLTACGGNRENVLIYSSAEDYRIEYMNERLQEEFPDYEITIEYMPTGNHAAKLISEGISTECDISHDLEYGYMEKLDKEGLFADLSVYDKDIYVDDVVKSNNYLAEYRNGGAVIVNTKILEEKGLAIPESYEDLLKPEYKGLISMPNPKSSGTGYMFLKSLVNEWGEERAFEYFEKLTENILQYTSSGSGPVNALMQEEAVIGLGMTGQAVIKINEGYPLEIVYFAEGSPYCIYGQSMIKGKDERNAVAEVFDFMVNTLNYEMVAKFFPEKIYKDKDYTIENYPINISYSDMSNNSIEEKNRLLERWTY